MQDQDEVIFRRFPDKKQEQVRQLVSWSRLLGLTGRDLVNIHYGDLKLDKNWNV